MQKLKTTVIVIVTFLSLLPVFPVTAAEIAGISLPDSNKAGDANLILNGSGIRRKFGVKAYIANLYLKHKTASSNDIINADEPMVLSMYWLREAEERKINLVFFKSFAISINAPVQKIYGSDSDYGELTESIVTFMSWLAEKPTVRDNIWTFKYIPGKGTHVYIYEAENKTETMKGIIPGLKFKKALLSIWIGDKQAVGTKMKADILGL